MARNGFDIRHVSKVGCLMQLHVFPSRTVFLHGHCVEACPYAYISDVPSCRVHSICRQPHLPNELSAYTALRFHGFPEPRYNTVVAENDPRAVGGELTFASPAFSEY